MIAEKIKPRNVRRHSKGKTKIRRMIATAAMFTHQSKAFTAALVPFELRIPLSGRLLAILFVRIERQGYHMAQ